MMEKKERTCLSEIQKKNPDVSQDELLECFSLVSKTKDSKGKPVAMKFLWMANGFDTILKEARRRIQSRKRLEQERAQAQKKASEEAVIEQESAPELVEKGKKAFYAALGGGLFQNHRAFQQPQTQSQSLDQRKAFLHAQSKQIQQIKQFGSI
ncbi:MAG: hypothetical protein ACO3A2_11645 [Bdellovibrionia bacterium]